MNSHLPKFQIFTGSNGQFYFRLRAAGNSEPILSSSEGYKTKAACQNGIASVKRHAAYDSCFNKEQTSTVYGIRYYFNLTAFNNEKIGKSELYNTAYDRDLGISLVKRSVVLAIIEDLVPHLHYAS